MMKRMLQRSTAAAVGPRAVSYPPRPPQTTVRPYHGRDSLWVAIGRRSQCTRRWLGTTTPDSKATIRNAFEILGVPQTFDLDAQDLKQKYRNLMSQHHPDRQQHQTTSPKNEGSDDASIITDAYDQLVNPHTRSVHLLELLGTPLLEEDGSKVVDMEFLMQVMQIRETIDQLLLSHEEDDAEALDAALKPLWHENQERILETCQELKEAFGSTDLDRALELTGRLQYWNRIDETIRERLNTLD